MIQDFAADIRQGVAPRYAALLASIDPNNAVLESIPEIADRMRKISYRTGQISAQSTTLPSIQNPNLGPRQVAVITVGADGQPTLARTNRVPQNNDLLRGGLSLISSDPEFNRCGGDFNCEYALEKADREAEEQAAAKAEERLLNELDRQLSEIEKEQPSRETQSPDAIDRGGPQISMRQILDLKRPQVIDPADAIQSVNISNRIPTGTVVDPEQDSAQSTVLIPVEVAIQAKTLDGRIIPLDGGGFNKGTFVEGKTSLQDDLCNAAGNCN